MNNLHIDDFCKDCALILLQLYRVFPRRHTVYVEDICGSDTPDEVGLHSDRHMAGLGAMLWLAEEGYIRYQSLVYQDAVDQAVLTQKSFIILTAHHGVAERNLAALIRQAVKKGSSNNITRIMTVLFAQQAMQPDVDEQLTECQSVNGCAIEPCA